MERKSVVLVTLLAIGTLLVAVVGTTFAYFTATVKGNDTATTTQVTTATIGVSYEDGAQISYTEDNPITPGWDQTKTIKVTNNSTVDISYDINWTGIINTFVNSLDADCIVNSDGTKTGCDEAPTTDEFYYSVIATTSLKDESTNPTSSLKPAPTFASKIPMPKVAANGLNTASFISNRTIAPDQVDIYVIHFYFVNLEDKTIDGVTTSGNQNANQGATFSAKFEAVVHNISA